MATPKNDGCKNGYHIRIQTVILGSGEKFSWLNFRAEHYYLVVSLNFNL